MAVYGRIRIVGAVVVGLVLALVITTLRSDPEPVPEVVQPPPMQAVRELTADPVWLDVSADEDADKPGAGRSVMGQLFFAQEARTTGPSPDSLRFRFDAPVEVTGVVISVDISGMELVEVVAGVNVEHPYGIEMEGDGRHQPFMGRDWLLHTSDMNDGGPSKIDEQVALPVPVELEAGDWVTVDAWLGNHTETYGAVSPEVILFYRWL